ncbi:MAG: hypothetical protein A2017_17530 [Lentisphaerae bacterium GWF2_44_16]|nr:MAG: hypothetical protein A2017_17530 [Lentisphaerae bacterium GWF2_44_16]
MKKNYRFHMLSWLIALLLGFFAMWLLVNLPDEFRGLPSLYVGFIFNWMAASPPRRLEHALFRKTDFWMKRFIIYDFESEPNIPLLYIYHQLLAYLYMIVGILLWGCMYVLFLLGSIESPDPARFVMMTMVWYTIGASGALMLVMIVLSAIDEIRYTGDFYVDSKIIR